ncbi:MAG: Na/Pi symporter [Planctomycetota bacterium]|nr:Na/Pi symporter [Planctomycetota bacterium]
MTPVKAPMPYEERQLPVWARLLFLLFLLCVFLTAIQLMSGAFKLLGKDQAKALFDGVSNPFAGLAVGILATVLVQSSSVTTATVVALVGSGELSITYAVPMVMGANIGTSVTNTLVSMGHIARRTEFRRAFAGATMHDFFNVMALAALLPIEIATGILEKGARWLTSILASDPDAAAEKFSSPIKSFFKTLSKGIESVVTEGIGLVGWPAALVILVIALAMIVLALMNITKTMRSLMADRVERALNEVLGRRGILAMAVGALMTVLVQSSSITTSLLVPMIGAGVLSMEAAFPITLGANLGTTVTGLLAALSAGPAGLTIALVHLLFNLVGIGLIYPIPWLRRFPIRCAEFLAERASRNRIWVGVYIMGVFVLMPLLGILLFK